MSSFLFFEGGGLGGGAEGGRGWMIGEGERGNGSGRG